MLHTLTPFPHAGSTAYLDEADDNGREVVEQVRILSAPDAHGEVLISLRSYRYRHEIARGNRRVPLADLRETEQPAPSGRKRSRSSGRAPKKASRR